MNNFSPVLPSIFICKKCGHRFERALPFGLFCPKCKSLNVEKDHFVVR